MNPTLPPFVQDLLDRGVDPLADPRAESWLLENPEALEAFAATRSALATLPREAVPVAPPAKVRWPRRALPWLAAAALLVAIGAAAAALTWGEAAPEPTAVLPRPDFAPEGAVVYSRVATTDRAGTRARLCVIEFQGARSADCRTLDRRAAMTRSMQIDLSERNWTVAYHTQERALMP